MSNRGISRIKSISLQFCDFGGSSHGVRNFIKSDKVYDIANNYKDVKFSFNLVRGSHPYIRVNFINRFTKSIPLRMDNSEEAEQKLQLTCNEIGRKPLTHNGFRVISYNKSIQGGWKSNMFNNKPLHVMQHFPQFPTLPIEEELIKKGLVKKNRRVPPSHLSKILSRSKHEFMDI